MPIFYRHIRLLLCLMFCLVASRLVAEDAGPSIGRVDVGIAGFYKNGCRTPIQLDFPVPLSTLADKDLFIETVDSDGVATAYRFPVQADSNGPDSQSNSKAAHSRTVYVKLGRATAPLSVSLVASQAAESGTSDRKAGKTEHEAERIRQTLIPTGSPEKNASLEEHIARPPGEHEKSEDASSRHDTTQNRFTVPLPADRPLYIVVGDANIGLQDAIAGLHLQESRRPALVPVGDFSQLPDHPDGYDAVDMVVLTTSRPEMFTRSPSNRQRIRALEEWMYRGGHVFFLAGKDAGPLVASDGPLESFLPGTFLEMTDLRQGEILQLFARSDRPLIMTGSEESPFLRMPRFRQTVPDPADSVDSGSASSDGAVILRDADQPLVVRAARGFGRLTYFGGDLGAEPLLSWRDRPLLVAAILGWSSDSVPASNRAALSLLHFGYGDLAGQLRSSLDAFDGTQIVPFSFLLFIMGVYCVVVGGLDWFVVHKVLKKPVLTWLTFPLWVLLFAVLAYALGFGNRLDKPACNCVALIDLDLAHRRERLSSWYAVYSPDDARYTLQSTYHEPGALAWNGLSGSGLGGMAPKTYAPSGWRDGYEIRTHFPASDPHENDLAMEPWSPHNTRLASLVDMPIAVRSTKALFAQSHSISERCDGTVRNVLQTWKDFPEPLREEQGVPVGTLYNPFGFPIEEAQLAFGRWMIEIGRIDARETVPVDLKNPRRELRDILYETRPEQTAFTRSTVSYAPQSRDPFYILRAMSFHEAVGGYDVVGLHNEYQGNLDFSKLLKTDRAVLIGKAGTSNKHRLHTDLYINRDRDESGNPNSLGAARSVFVVRMVIPVMLAESKKAADFSGQGALDSKEQAIEEQGGFDTMKTND